MPHHDSDGCRTRIESYYDAAPRSAARTEEHGPFTLFVGEGPWPYYARPRLGDGDGGFTREAVEAARERLRELGQPEAFEWVHETTPDLLAATRAAGLDVLEAPLMILDRAAFRAPGPPPGVELRVLEPDDDALAAALAVADVGFGAPGTAAGPEGMAERDRAVRGSGLGFRRDRMRRRLTVTAIADGGYGPIAVGSHNPVGDATEIVGVATLPAVRRQGLGGAVTGALVEDALAGGAELVFLSAGNEAIARVYVRLGFRRIGTACIVG
jgi:ribosomal protein S18 acetylase RimI-like enzyme